MKKLDRHTSEVIKKSASSMLVKITGMLIGFAVSIVLGRTLGPDGLGIINLSNRIISICLIFSFLGFGQVIIKKIAIAYSESNFKLIKDILFTAFIINGIVSFILSVVLIACAEYLSDNLFHTPALKYPLILASLAYVPQMVSRIISSTLIGYGKLWQSNLVNETLSVAVTGFFLVLLWLLGLEINTINTAISYAGSRVVVMGVMLVVLTTYNKGNFRKIARRPDYIGREMLAMGFPLLIANAALLVSSNADIVMIGWLSSAREVGLYSIASRLALLTNFLLQITTSAVAPKIAVLFRDNRVEELEAMIQKITIILVVTGVIPMVLFIVWGKPILSLWGNEFSSAYPALVILAVGQFVNISTGPVGNLLIMTGSEKTVGNITMFTVLLNLVLNYYLIRSYGCQGAAFATSFTLILNMTLCYFFVRKRMKIKIYKII